MLRNMIVLVLVLATVALFFSGFATKAAVQPANAGPDCEQYLEKAIRSAQSSDREAMSSYARQSLAWSAIYRNCMGR